jgi:hypothetical protein
MMMRSPWPGGGTLVDREREGCDVLANDSRLVLLGGGACCIASTSTAMQKRATAGV